MNPVWANMPVKYAVEMSTMLRCPPEIASDAQTNLLISHCLVEPYVGYRMTHITHEADRTSLLNKTELITNEAVPGS